VLHYPKFQAVCIGAKNCTYWGSYTIQGKNGTIRQATPANTCGPITLELDGMTQVYDENRDQQYGYSLFSTMASQIENRNLDMCYSALSKSLDVMKVLTELKNSVEVTIK
jgi:hypothetical protein